MVPDRGIFVVADGMGGHQGGDIASQLIVASLAELPSQDGFDERLKGVRQCLHWLNRRLGQELTVTAERRDCIMGSTVVVLLLEGNRAVCTWAGDNRVVVENPKRELLAELEITRDGVRLDFRLPATHDPFVKMLLLTAESRA